MKNKGHIKIAVILATMFAIFGAIGGSYLFAYGITDDIKDGMKLLSERLVRIETTIEIFAETRETMEKFNKNSEVLEEILLDYQLNIK